MHKSVCVLVFLVGLASATVDVIKELKDEAVTSESSLYDLCAMPSRTGRCRARVPRYFYDRRTDKCELFMWGGCGGNANRFRSVEECEARCSAPAATAAAVDDEYQRRRRRRRRSNEGCDRICTQVFRPVCDTDGRVYPNRCQFEAVKCADPSRVLKGPCPLLV